MRRFVLRRPLHGRRGGNAVTDHATAGPIARYGSGKEALKGEIVVATGTLLHGQRAAVHELIIATGGPPGKSLTRKTTMLVVGIPSSGTRLEGSTESRKMLKATQLREAGTQFEVVTEDEFFRRLES